MCLDIAINFANVFALDGLAAERYVQPIFDKAAFDAVYLALTHLQHLGNVFAGALALAALRLVAVEQDQCVDDFLRCVFAFTDQALQLLGLFGREGDDVFFHPAIL